MKPQVILEKSCMAFKLKDGETLLISKEDVQSIANSLVVEMMVHNNTNVYIHKNNALKTCSMLYDIVVAEEKTMSKKLRENYLKAILKFSDKGAGKDEYITLKKSIESGGKL